MVRSLAFSVLLITTVPALGGVPPKPSEMELREGMDAALAEAEQVPESERRDWQRSLVMKSASGNREDQIHDALLAIALRPRDARGALRLIEAVGKNRRDGVYMINEEESRADREAAKAFVEDLYRRRAGTIGTAIDWRGGLAELLMYLGKFDEALKLDRETVAVIDDPQYVRVRLAILEMIAGNPSAFSNAIAKCDGPTPEYKGMTESYCASAARSIATRVKGALGSAAPREIDDILAGRGQESISWNERMHGLAQLVGHDRKRARVELRQVLAAPDAPLHVKNDAVLLLARCEAYDGKSSDALPLYDCWIARRGIVFPELPADAWQQITAMDHHDDAKEPLEIRETCLDHDFGEERPVDFAGPCIMDFLMQQLIAATNSGTWPVARQTIERAAAVIVATRRSAAPLERMLKMYATATISPSRKEEIARVLRYAENLGYADVWPINGAAQELLRGQTERVVEPWTTPLKLEPTTAPCR